MDQASTTDMHISHGGCYPDLKAA